MADRWDEIETLFESALDRPREERITWLYGTCHDPQLRAEVERLLKAHEQTGGILDAPLPLDAADFELPDDGADGPPIGPYRLLREIGRGGTSVVYLAEREAPFRQRVALKLLRSGLDTEDLVRRFLAERQILASLNHPNIARLLDGGVSEAGRPYFVMELVEGLPITHSCDEHRLSVEQRLDLFRRVCEAVAYAHRRLVVHRDLKPSNIFVTEDEHGAPQVKLLDFGIAKLLDPTALPVAPPRTRTGLRPMTPEYASPEQVRFGPITTATDVYSLGVVLYELLAGRRPYRITGRTPGEVERVICEEEPTRPSTVVTRQAPPGHGANAAPEEASQARSTTPDRLQRMLRGDLDLIVLKTLRKEPERRYDSAEQLAADIERYRSARPVQARPDSVGYRLRTFAKRHRWSVAAAVGFVLLLAGYAVTVTLQNREIARERDRARIAAIKTEHVKDFLIDLFAQSEAEAAEGDTAAVRNALASGAARIRREMAGQPEIRAEMVGALGDVYQRLGRFDAARPLLEEALAARRATLPPSHPDIGSSLLDLAEMEQHAGRTGRAEALYREALAGRRQVTDEERIGVAEIQNRLAGLLQAAGRSDEAEALYEKALRVYRGELGGGHGQTATLMASLAALKCEAGNDDGVALYEEALALERKRLGLPHAHVALLRGELGACLSALGRYDEAEPHLLASLTSLRASDDGEESDGRRTVRAHLVALYEAWGKPEQAQTYEDTSSVSISDSVSISE